MKFHIFSWIVLVTGAVRCTKEYDFERSSLEVSPNVTTSEEGVTIPAFSALQCASACVAMETCVAISYREGYQLCLLRDDQHLFAGLDTAQSFGTTTQFRKVLEGECSDYWTGGYRTSGPYRLTLPGVGPPFTAVCDFQTEGGPWIMFQRRVDGSEDFYRNWSDYQVGFGSLHGEFWMGNELLHQLTDSGWTELRVDLEDFEGERRYATYSFFSVASASDNYRLNVSGYNGTAGDGMDFQNGCSFSTLDRDFDTTTQVCTVLFHGAWWYADCHCSNLNGAYLRGPHTSYADGVDWCMWRGDYYSLKVSEMKLRKPPIP